MDLNPNSDLGAMQHRDKQLATTRELERWRELSGAFQQIGYYFPWLSNFSSPGEAERIPTALISSDFFKTLDVRPALGRCSRPLIWCPARIVS